MIFIFIILSSFSSIISYLFQRFPQARNLLLFNSGQIDNLAGRDTLFSLTVAEIKNNPFLPRGFMVDRIILGRQNISANIYPHNFFLEIILQFGIFGWIFSIWFIRSFLQTYYTILRKKNIIIKISFISFLVIAITKLMITGSYVSDMQSWFAFGFFISVYRQIEKL